MYELHLGLVQTAAFYNSDFRYPAGISIAITICRNLEMASK